MSVHVFVVTVRVQALSALPARLGSKQCLFRSSCLREMAVYVCMDTRAHTHAFRKMKSWKVERLISSSGTKEERPQWKYECNKFTCSYFCRDRPVFIVTIVNAFQ